jgi:hypothetical protein
MDSKFKKNYTLAVRNLKIRNKHKAHKTIAINSKIQRT